MIVLFRMFSKYFLFKFFVLFVINIQYVKCAKYKMIIEDPEVFTPCTRDPDHFVEEFVDLSHLNRTFLRDGNIYVNGYLEVIKDFAKPVKLNVLVYKQVGSNWMSTLMNMQKPDLCKALSEKNTFWTSIANQMEIDACPFRKGFQIKMDLIIELFLSIPALQAEGKYRVEFIMSSEGIPDIYCAQGEGTAVLHRK